MKITNTIHALKHTFLIPANPELKIERFVYSFIIFGKENICLIDSGVSDSATAIFNYIIENERSVNEIKTLIFTHSHPDHIGSAKIIKEKTNCKVIAHSEEKDWIENIDKQFSDRPVPGFHSFVDGSVKINAFVEDGQILNLEDGLSIKIIHTPGHSKGSISLLFEDAGILICGDALLLPGSLPIYDDVVESVNSIKKLQNLDNLKILLSSWDDPCKDSQVTEKINKSINYFKALHKTISEIENVKALEPMELCNQVINKMKLPPVAVNSLVAKSFQSNVMALDNDILN